MSKAPQQQSGVAGTELVAMMAKEQHLDPQAYASTVMKSCFDSKNDTTPEQFMAFLMIAREHKLNPITREIYAFAKGGKVSPIVSIDGWLKIINEHPAFDGMQFKDELDDAANLIAVTCKIFRKDRGHPTEVTEYLDECKMPTEPWKKWPARMLRHKATIQAARYAFGFSGIYDADEAQRIEATDLQGHATIVEDEPESPAKRIMHKVQAKVTEQEMPPVIDEQELSVDEIPGLKKGSEIVKGETSGAKMPDGEELSPENQEWIDDMEKAE